MKIKVKESILRSKYLVFMKGTVKNPMCGFSRFAIEILKFYEIPKLSFVNVLSDPNIRTVVKEITEWSTFPQVFVNGELIGGSDVLMELHKDEVLKDILFSNK